MNKLLLLSAALVGQALGANGQAHKAHAYELGVEGLNYSAATQPSRPRFQALSGGFFRYAPKRLGARAGLALGQQTTPADISNCADCLSGATSSQTFTWRAGGQFAPLTQSKWFYAFVDGAYRTIKSTGRYTGGLCGCLDETATETTRTVGAMAGLGASWQILSRFYLSPELYYEVFGGRKTSSYLDNRTGGISAFSQRVTEHTPAFRLQASVAF